MMGAVTDRQHAALAEHHVEAKLARQAFVQAQREIVKTRTLGVEVVRAHHRGVAPGIAAAEPAPFNHRHLRDAVLPGQVIGGREAVAAASDDDHIVFGFRAGAAPELWPVLVIEQCITRKGESGKPHGVTAPYDRSLPTSATLRW